MILYELYIWMPNFWVNCACLDTIAIVNCTSLCIISNYKRCYLPGMNGGLWHHICLTWSSFLGKVQFFLDGSRIKTISGYRENVTVPEGGILRIGQRQLEVGGSHSSIKAYEGQLTRINIWNTVLADSVIEALALTPGAEIGNFLSWRDIRTSIFSGLVSIQDGADPQPLGKT